MATKDAVKGSGGSDQTMHLFRFDTATVIASGTSDPIRFPVSFEIGDIDQLSVKFASDDITVKIYEVEALSIDNKVLERQFLNAIATTPDIIGFQGLGAGYSVEDSDNKVLYMSIVNNDGVNATGVMSVKVVTKKVA